MNAHFVRISQITPIFSAFFCFTSLAMLVNCAWSGESAGFSIDSPAFANNSKIPPKYGCGGDNESPPLTWREAPAKTRSYALVVSDPDAPGGVFIHWVMFDIPGDVHELKPGVARNDALPQGINSFGRIGYDGPCPPPGPTHHYKFNLMALDSVLDLRPGATAVEVESQAAAHRLATTELVGVFAR